ncbi:hypothetical protein GL50803_0015013 [Giardia duodenalis]|uniref:Uncharacterized protein n=1 Tax=Giardia intestinalis (strain ATCC 50803 / WB clone C6) TaxID=184922 RepID=D3KIC5_GIAIC|nr:hypothetical protein GL50803_0015013 [Giardia intestinalis]KAE8305456.1 hypothetical protein GL50803_0015013 [Giardia intestinalis]
MGLAGSRQDEDMFLAMLSPSQKARLLKRKLSSSSSSSSQQKNSPQQCLQRKPPKDKPRTKLTAVLPLIPKGYSIQGLEARSTSQDDSKKSNGRAERGALGHTRASGSLGTDGLYADFSFFAFRPAEVAHDFHLLDFHGHGHISRRTLGMALAKQFTKYDVVCTETLYKLSATVEDIWFIWEYAYTSVEVITCEVYVQICYFLYRLPKIRGFPYLLSYYLHDTNYSQCLSADAFGNALTALYSISSTIVKNKIRDYEKSHRTNKKNTFGEDDFVHICNSLKISAKRQHLVDQYLSKLQLLDSLPLLNTKYKLDPIALAQPNQCTNPGITDCVGSALAYFYSISGTIYNDCTLTASNLREFNRIRTKDFICKVCEEYQSHTNISTSKNPLTRLSVVGGSTIEGKRNEDWSSTSSGSTVEVLTPLFKIVDEDFKASASCTTEAKNGKLDTVEVEDPNTPLGLTMKISLGLDAQDTLSETRSVIYSFEVDTHGQLQRIQSCDDKRMTRKYQNKTATMKDALSQRLSMIATVHVAKGYVREMDFEGDSEVIIAKSGSFCSYKDADKLQMITHFHAL